MGDKFNLSGDFSGAIINLKSTLHNVRQTAGQIPGGDDEARKQLQNMIDSLSAELEKAPVAKKEEVEAVAQTAKVLVEQAKSGKPNKVLLRITGEGLKQSAKDLAEFLPSVLPITVQIVSIVLKISGN
jgi:hypothetical protein